MIRILKKWPHINEEDINAVTDQLLSGEISSAGKIDVINSLENKFKELTNSKYCIAMSSGTMALFSAIFSINILPGDEVLVPVYTYHAVAAPLISINAKPVFLDIDSTFGHIDTNKIENKITNKTKAIIIVHSYGYPVNMEPVLSIAKKHNLKVIEDCSHAHGARYNGYTVGSIGDVGFFSLQASKLVPAGEGGILVTNNQDIYEKSLLLGHHMERTSIDVKDEQLKRFVNTGLGLKLRINPLGAALANSQINRLQDYIKERQYIYSYISNKFDGLSEICPITPKNYMTTTTFYSYRFKYKSFRNEKFQVFLDELKRNNLNISKPSGQLLPNEKIFCSESFRIGFIEKKETNEKKKLNEFEGAENFLNSIFRLPSHYTDKNKLDTMLDKFAYIYNEIHK